MLLGFGVQIYSAIFAHAPNATVPTVGPLRAGPDQNKRFGEPSCTIDNNLNAGSGGHGYLRTCNLRTQVHPHQRPRWQLERGKCICFGEAL